MSPPPPALSLLYRQSLLSIACKCIRIVQANNSYLSALLRRVPCQTAPMDSGLISNGGRIYIASTVEMNDEHHYQHYQAAARQAASHHAADDNALNESHFLLSSKVEFTYDNGDAIPLQTPQNPRLSNQKKKNKPRFYMNPYIVFTKSCWAEFRTANPDAKIDQECFRELTRHFAAKWKELSPEQKIPFEEKSATDKARYKGMMDSYKNKSLTGKKAASSKEGGTSLNSYMYFVQDERDKVRQVMPQLTMAEVSNELGRRWNQLDPAVKEVYKTIADEARKRVSAAKQST